MEKLTARYALTAAAEYQKNNDDVSISDFAEGYMKAIQETNIIEMLNVLLQAKEQIEHLKWKLEKDGSSFGDETTKDTVQRINNAIKKATEYGNI